MAPASTTLHDQIRILIVSLPATGDIQIAEDQERYSRFVDAARRAGFDARHEIVLSAEDFSSLLTTARPDLVFCSPHSLPVLKELPPGTATDRKINLHELLENLGIPYVGSDPHTILLALCKTSLKERWKTKGVATPDFVHLHKGDSPDCIQDLAFPAFPCIVKPSKEGNSRGISSSSVVHDRDSLMQMIRQALEDFGDILVEHYLGFAPDFHEYTVAMIGSPGRMLVMPAELGFKVPRFPPLITNEDKDGHCTCATAIEDPAILKAVADFARTALMAAGVRDYARCDMVFADGCFQAIEINGQPMVPDRWFESCAQNAGLDESAYLCAILLAAIVRYAKEGHGRLIPPPGMASLIPEPFHSFIIG